jgi:hypothetical protein
MLSLLLLSRGACPQQTWGQLECYSVGLDNETMRSVSAAFNANPYRVCGELLRTNNYYVTNLCLGRRELALAAVPGRRLSRLEKAAGRDRAANPNYRYNVRSAARGHLLPSAKGGHP